MKELDRAEAKALKSDRRLAAIGRDEVAMQKQAEIEVQRRQGGAGQACCSRGNGGGGGAYRRRR